MSPAVRHHFRQLPGARAMPSPLRARAGNRARRWAFRPSIVGVLAVAATALTPAVAAHAAAGGDELTSGQTLTSGQELVHGNFELVMGADGNLVNKACGHAIWASGTPGNSGAYLIMGTGGNLKIISTSGATVWSTGTGGHSGADAILGADDNLGVYYNGSNLWMSHTSGDSNCDDRLFDGQSIGPGPGIMMPDLHTTSGSYKYIPTTYGSEILNGSGTTIWQWICQGGYSKDYTVSVGQTGNLWEISPDGQRGCATGTSTPGGSYLMMQTDGNLVLYTDWHTVLWSSGT